MELLPKAFIIHWIKVLYPDALTRARAKITFQNRNLCFNVLLVPLLSALSVQKESPEEQMNNKHKLNKLKLPEIQRSKFG